MRSYLPEFYTDENKYFISLKFEVSLFWIQKMTEIDKILAAEKRASKIYPMLQ